MLITAAVLGVSLFVAISLFVYFGQGRLLFIPGRAIDITPDQVGLEYEDLFIEVAPSERLNAWYFPSPDAKPETRTVLFCHGNAGNISHRLETVGLLLDLGVNVLIFDYRGYGRSDGVPTEDNMYADVRAAYHWLRDARGADPEGIFLFGRSLGGAVAIDLAVSEPCAGVVIESSFTSTVDMGRRLYPFLPVKLLARYRFDSISKIGRVTAKILITHSPVDEMIPYAMGRKLYEAASGDKTFLPLSGGHNDQSYFGNDDYRRGLRAFLGTIGQAPAEDRGQID